MKNRSVTIRVMVMVCVMAVANIASADTFGADANQFTIDFVNISGDTNPTSGIPIGRGFTFTGVNNDYRIGTYEITNDQWDKFCVTAGTPAGSWVSGTYPYDRSSGWTGTNVPTNAISWYEAAQFVNWLNTSTGHQAAYKFTGTRGTNNYTFAVWDAIDAWGGTNLHRHKDAFYFLPTEDEWVKAAYWNDTSIQTYSNASPSDLVSGEPDPTKWNYKPSAGSEPWNVNSGVEELNGTLNMVGNVFEWMESPYYDNDYGTTLYQCIRGGGYYSDVGHISSAYRYSLYPYSESTVTFRVASVPEPATLLLLGLGGLMVRRKQ